MLEWESGVGSQSCATNCSGISDSASFYQAQEVDGTGDELMKMELQEKKRQLGSKATKITKLPRVDLEFREEDLQQHLKMVRGFTQAEEAAHLSNLAPCLDPEQPKSVLQVEERLQIIHLAKTHKMPLKEIARLENKMLSTVRSVVLNFKKHGRINKLLTLSAKKLIMEKRAHR